MKRIFSACVFFLMFVVAVAQQTTNNEASVTSNTATNAIEHIKVKAEQGNAEAQLFLGYCYEHGKWVVTNMTEAVKWYLKAAEQGNVDAQYMVGNAYQLANGVAKNYTEAARWYSRAAAQGDIFAQLALGMCYENGNGVPENNVEAYKWFNLAAAHSANDEKEKELIDNAAILRDSMVKLGISPEEIAEAQQFSAAFIPKNETPNSNSASSGQPIASGSGFFITDDGYLISNYHVVKDATKIRLVTSAGTIDAKVVQVDAANDLALLKADGKFSPLPVAASRSAHLGGTVATIGFPDPSLQGFSPKLAKGEIASLSGAGDDPRYFQISVPVQPGNSGGALVDERGNVIGIVVGQAGCVGGAGGERGVAGGCELRGEEQPALELSGIGAGGFGQAQSAQHGG
jgi:S1-C subfamily serine protease